MKAREGMREELKADCIILVCTFRQKSRSSRCEKLMKIKLNIGWEGREWEKITFFRNEKEWAESSVRRRLYTWKVQRLIPSGIEWEREREREIEVVLNIKCYGIKWNDFASSTSPLVLRFYLNLFFTQCQNCA